MVIDICAQRSLVTRKIVARRRREGLAKALEIPGVFRLIFAMPKSRGKVDRNGILEAIRKAAVELGRPPHRGELPRVAGISHSVVLKHFANLRDAVRAAGMEPSRQGLKVPAEDLLRDFARVAAELGHAPNRNEYVRHGKYAAGTFYANFRSWSGVKQAVDEMARAASPGQLPELTRLPKLRIEIAHGRESTRIEQCVDKNGDQQGSAQEMHEADKAIALQWAGAMTALPGELAGKRRVTDAVCAMIVNTLMGEEAGLKWQRVMMGLEPLDAQNCQNCPDCQRLKIENRMPETAWSGNGSATLARVNGSVTSGGIIDDERPVMGPPFYPCALSNAPVNEMGVMILFGMLAGELGFQIAAVQGKYPDILARRQIQPGRWQDVRIEAEYESRNFAQHGHDPAKCDIIVCWRHNWVKCPKEIEVIELSRIVRSRVIAEIAT